MLRSNGFRHLRTIRAKSASALAARADVRADVAGTIRQDTRREIRWSPSYLCNHLVAESKGGAWTLSG